MHQSLAIDRIPYDQPFIFVANEGIIEGPFSRYQMLDFFARGQLSERMHVYFAGLQHWIPFSLPMLQRLAQFPIEVVRFEPIPLPPAAERISLLGARIQNRGFLRDDRAIVRINVHNISATGVLVGADDLPFQVETQLRLSVAIGNKLKIYDSVCEVVRVDDHNQAYGLRFGNQHDEVYFLQNEIRA